MKYTYAILLSLLLLSCATEKTYTIKTEDQQSSVILPTDPAQMQFQSVYWYVVTEKNLDAFLKQLKTKESGGVVVFYAMVPKDYGNLALNNQEMKRYIDQQRLIIQYFKKYLTSAEKNGSKSAGPSNK